METLALVGAAARPGSLASITIAVGAAIAALVPLYAMWITFKQRTDTDWETHQSDKIEELRNELAEAKADLARLTEKNLELAQRLADLLAPPK